MKTFLSILLTVIFLGCVAQGPVIISSPAPKEALPEPGKSTSAIPSPRYAPPVYSHLFVGRFFNPLPYPVKLIIMPGEEYLIRSAQEYDIPFEKGIEPRDVYAHGVVLDSDDPVAKENMEEQRMYAIGTFRVRVRVPARDDPQFEDSILIDQITEFRYQIKRR